MLLWGGSRRRHFPDILVHSDWSKFLFLKIPRMRFARLGEVLEGRPTLRLKWLLWYVARAITLFARLQYHNSVLLIRAVFFFCDI